jgi:hypothetical protein
LIRSIELAHVTADATTLISAKRRLVNWVVALHRHEDHWRIHRRAPRENTRNRASLPGHERRLAEWARYQRRYQDNLCGYQLLRLDVSPSFQWDPQEAAWKSHFEACLRHRRLTGTLPYLNSSDTVEFTRARWLGRQLRQLKTGTLRPDRAQLLAELLRG